MRFHAFSTLLTQLLGLRRIEQQRLQGLCQGRSRVALIEDTAAGQLQ